MRPFTFAVVVLAAMPPATAVAQDPLPVRAGDRVRITAPDLGLYRRIGVLTARRGDTLTLDSVRVAFASVHRVEVSRGRRSNSRWGALIGAGMGLVFFAYRVSVCSSFICDGVVAAFPIVVGGGAGIGALVGWLIKTERWEEVPLDQLRVSFVPQRDGRFAVVGTLRF